MTALHEIFSSKGKTRIIEVIFLAGEINITRIMRKSKLNHQMVNKYIEELKNEQIIREKRFGRIRIISINKSNPQTAKISDFINSWYQHQKEHL